LEAMMIITILSNQFEEIGHNIRRLNGRKVCVQYCMHLQLNYNESQQPSYFSIDKIICS